jgi:hypothetical protein
MVLKLRRNLDVFSEERKLNKYRSCRIVDRVESKGG